MKHILFVLVLLVGVTSVVAAGDFEDGKDALAHKDFTTAFNKFLSAAEVGHTRAQYMLGVLYTNGNGVRKNDVQAHKWFSLSAASATDARMKDIALSSRNAIAQTMTPEGIAEAEQLARDWHGT